MAVKKRRVMLSSLTIIDYKKIIDYLVPQGAGPVKQGHDGLAPDRLAEENEPP
ncbi:hypothetical protein [Phreatobacter sp.]|uniref:hypothetical protein n=1 Tax=Phreatobacter sp. TaxID=1966341 RepID=UPI003F6F8067